MLTDPRMLRFYAAMSGAVMLKLVLIVGGCMLGSWLDKRFGTHPWGFFAGMTIGMGLGLWWVIYVANRKKF